MVGQQILECFSGHSFIGHMIRKCKPGVETESPTLPAVGMRTSHGGNEEGWEAIYLFLVASVEPNLLLKQKVSSQGSRSQDSRQISLLLIIHHELTLQNLPRM